MYILPRFFYNMKKRKSWQEISLYTSPSVLRVKRFVTCTCSPVSIPMEPSRLRLKGLKTPKFSVEITRWLRPTKKNVTKQNTKNKTWLPVTTKDTYSFSRVIRPFEKTQVQNKKFRKINSNWFCQIFVKIVFVKEK